MGDGDVEGSMERRSEVREVVVVDVRWWFRRAGYLMG